MLASVDGGFLGEAAARLAAVADTLDDVRARALAALAVVDRWTDHARVDALLSEGADRCRRLAADHGVRSELVAALEAAAWTARAGPAGPGIAGWALPPAPGDHRPGRRGTEPGAFLAAGEAMLNGLAPAAAGVDQSAFPAWYTARFDRMQRLQSMQARLEAAMRVAADRAGTAQVIGDRDAERAAWAAFRAHQAAVEIIAARLDGALASGPAVGLGEVVAYVQRVPGMGAADRDRVVGDLLARRIEADFTDPEAMLGIARVVATHLTSPPQAAALFNALPAGMLPLLAGSAHHPARRQDIVSLTTPFAAALARAERSSSLQVGGAALVGDHLLPGLAAWFVDVDTHDPAFLLDAAVAAIAVGGSDRYVPWAADAVVDGRGRRVSYDARTHILDQLAAAGSAVATEFVRRISRRDLLDVFLRPATPYGDGGVAAGRVLALLGANLDRDAARLTREAMAAVAAAPTRPGVLEGAAAMVAPHLTSLLDPRLARHIEQTALAGVLWPDAGEAATAFLRRVLAHPPSAEIVFVAAQVLLLGALDRAFDPTDSESIAGVSREFGLLVDDLAAIYLDGTVSAARDRDRLTSTVQSALGLAVDLALAGGIALASPAAIAAAVAEVVAAGATNLLLPGLLERVLPVGNVERALAAGYVLENRFTDLAVVHLLSKLHAAGVIALPAEWFRDGSLEPPTLRELRRFEAALPDEVRFAAWINDAVSIGGAIGWVPRSG